MESNLLALTGMLWMRRAGRQGGEEEARSPTEMVKLNGQQLRDSLRPQNGTATLKSGAPPRAAATPAAGEEYSSNVWTSLSDTDRVRPAPAFVG